MKLSVWGGVSATILAWSAGAAAFAQAPPATETRAAALDEVVVTARRQEERLQEVPVVVTAFSAADLAERSITELADLQGAVPSLQFGSGTSIQGRKAFSFALRGLRSSAVTTYSSELVRDPRTIADFYDLQAVEVLQGPQGTLFGSSSTSGAIIFRPATPTDTFEGFLEGRAGNYGMFGGALALNVPVSESLAVRFAMDGEDREGFVDRPTGDAMDNDTHFGARFSARWTPTDWFNNLTVLEGYSYSILGAYRVPLELRPCTGAEVACLYDPANALFFGYSGAPVATLFADAQARGPFSSTQTHPPENKLQSQTVSNITDVDVGSIFGSFFGDVTFRSILGYTNVDSYDDFDTDGYPLDIVRFINAYETESTSFEGQMRGAGLDGRFNWVLGVYYRDSETSLDNETVIFDGTYFQTNYYTVPGRSNLDESTQRAVYGQVGMEILDDVTLTAGYRATRTEVSTVGSNIQYSPFSGFPPFCGFSPGAGVDLTTCTRTASATFDEPSWTVGLDWQINPDTLVYVVTRRGFNQGGFNTGAVTPERQAFGPERLTDVEIGVKRDWDLGDAQLRTNVALFHNTYADVQRSQTLLEAGNYIAFTTNASEATLNGVEFETELALTNGLSFRFNGAYLDAQYDSFPFTYTAGAPPVLISTDLAGNTIAQAPEWTLNAALDYTRDLSGLGVFSMTLDYAYQSELNFSDFNQNNPQLSNTLDTQSIEGAYGIWNARIGLAEIASSDVSVNLWVRNLADELYYVSRNNLGPFGISSGQPGEPRTYGVTVRQAF